MKVNTMLLNVSLLALAFASATHAWANPTGGTVASGSATFANTGTTLTITNAPNTIINWQGFSIAAGETTRFVQQSSNSAVLNRVTTQSASSILGGLQSNGRVFLVNPNGILFGSGAQVNTASFTATTINISDSAFLSGNTTTSGAGSTVSFDGLMTVDGSLNVGAIGITTDGTLSFSGKDVMLTGDVMTLNGTISTGGNLSLGTQNNVTPISLGLPLLNESRVYAAPEVSGVLLTTSHSIPAIDWGNLTTSNASISTGNFGATAIGNTVRNITIGSLGTGGNIKLASAVFVGNSITGNASRLSLAANTGAGTNAPSSASGITVASPSKPLQPAPLMVTSSSLKGETVVSGNAGAAANSGGTVIHQSTLRSAITWETFSIPASDATKFSQPSNSSATLNRVATQSPSPVVVGALQPKRTVLPATPNGNLGAAITSARAVSVGVNLQKREPLF